MTTLNNYCTDILKALGQDTRLKIVDSLRFGDRCVFQIYEDLHAQQSNTSRHLSLLVKSSILVSYKDDRRSYYSIKHPAVLNMIEMAQSILSRISSSGAPAGSIDFHGVASIFALLGQPTRLAIIETLQDKELCYSDVIRSVEQKKANASLHLTALVEGMILSRRGDKGFTTYYKVRHQEILDIVATVKRLMARETRMRQEAICQAEVESSCLGKTQLEDVNDYC